MCHQVMQGDGAIIAADMTPAISQSISCGTAGTTKSMCRTTENGMAGVNTTGNGATMIGIVDTTIMEMVMTGAVELATDTGITETS